MRKELKHCLIDISVDGKKVVVSPAKGVCSSLDIYKSSEINSFLKGVLNRIRPVTLVMDLSNVEFIDSSVVGVFIYVEHYMKNQGMGNFMLINIQKRVCDTFKMLGISSLLSITELNNSSACLNV